VGSRDWMLRYCWCLVTLRVVFWVQSWGDSATGMVQEDGATLGVFFLALAIVVYLTMTTTSSLYILLIASAISGIGTSMFFPANNSAVMANARQGGDGSISGLLRTVQNIGLVGSYVLAISVAASPVPRHGAFEVFIGTSSLSRGVSSAFLGANT
jgi:hypothetical protein